MIFSVLLTTKAAQTNAEGGGKGFDSEILVPDPEHRLDIPDGGEWSELFDTAQTQVALDNAGFLPGIIDGQKGKKTDQALKFAQLAGVRIFPTKAWNSWGSWQVPKGYFDDLGAIPESWLARSKLASMSYETAIEKLAEQFHCTEAFLGHLNPEIKDWTHLQTGITLRVPTLSPHLLYDTFTSRLLTKADHLEIRLAEKIIVAEDPDDHPLASFPCSIAAKKEKRPLGELVVRVLAPHPNYLFDPIFFPEVPEAAKIKSKLMIPPGPNNPVGVMWIGLGATATGKALEGIGIHGTPHPEEIGRTESHGCFRMTNWDVQRLATMVKIGTRVVVKEKDGE